jgi:hypothetical protein
MTSTAVGDTTVTFTSGTGINVGDIIAFSTTAATTTMMMENNTE